MNIHPALSNVPVEIAAGIATILGGDRQALFDKMVRHAVTMPSKAFNRSVGPNACVYRDGIGGKCLVGCLIPDELYHPELERKRADKLVALDDETGAADFLRSCQSAHDTSDSRYEMLMRLKELASHFDLFIYEIDPRRVKPWQGKATITGNVK